MPIVRFFASRLETRGSIIFLTSISLSLSLFVEETMLASTVLFLQSKMHGLAEDVIVNVNVKDSSKC